MEYLLAALALFNMFSVTTVHIPRSFPNAIVPFFVFAFAVSTTELAWLWLCIQALVALACVWAGALDTILGLSSCALLLLSWLGLLWNVHLGLRTGLQAERSLSKTLGRDYREMIPPRRREGLREAVKFGDWCRPFTFRRDDVELLKDLQYGSGGVRQALNIYRPTELPDGGCPVLLQIHGGGWVSGSKDQQALPLMYFLASRGWICVSINYRLSPSVGFPAHLHDCKRALAWIRTEGASYGMNPDFVAVTGGSAGGHLAALMALTPNQADLQPGFEQVNTSLQACVPLYGIYDMLNRFDQHAGHHIVREVVDNRFLHSPRSEDESLWNLASPIHHLRGDAPPFLVIHGNRDSLIPVTEGRVFQQKLREVSRNAVAYLELDGAEHAFENFHSPRTEHTVNAVHRFLEWALAKHNPRV